MSKYETWRSRAVLDPDLAAELADMEGDAARIEDAFFRDLEFGTGGLRGVIGAGTNRMNVYTVGKASQGLANYILAGGTNVRSGASAATADAASYKADSESTEGSIRSVAISYDSRIKSDLFSRTAAGVFAANGIRVYIYSELMPTPCLSYAVRELGCDAGIMVTASHNPARYNGYKVYGPDGCQITTEAAAAILAQIERLDEFEDVKGLDGFEDGISSGMISYIPESIYDSYTRTVLATSVLGDVKIDRDVAIVYTPLNGTGLKPVTRALSEAGYSNVTIVEEQAAPDGHFPTCPYPNPEIREAMALGIEYAKRADADILIATDPDCDRCGIAIKDIDGSYRLMTGNETGLLLTDYICARRLANGTMPTNPVMVKTIVTTDTAAQIAEHYHVRTIDVLTGFKFIGEQIGLLEREGSESSYIFGFEESYGYLSGSYVRDKDGVNAVLLICEMFAYYRSLGQTILQRLDELYAQYGYRLNTLYSYTYEGAAGFARMQSIMQGLRSRLAAGEITELAGLRVERVLDYNEGIDGLPRSDVLKFVLEGRSSVVIRPSGTEPKLKAYVSICADSREKAAEAETQCRAQIDEWMR